MTSGGVRWVPVAAALALVTVAVSSGVTMRGQDAAVRLHIVSPGEGAYLSGPVMLKALTVPLNADRRVARLTFFADGRQICGLDGPPFECAWDAGARIKEHVIRAVAVLDTGERLVQSVRTKGLDYAQTVNVDVVQVTAVVTDASGRFVKGLKRSDFRVFEDDVEQHISYFGSAEDAPLELVTAIDVSGSMVTAMDDVKAAARTFLGALKPTDQVSLLAFNDNLFTLARSSTNRVARLRAVDRLAAWGGTALYDVIVKALDMVGHQQGRRAIVVFSDGQDENSFVTEDRVISRVEASDSTLYMIGQGDATRSAELQALLRRLAEVSGGRAFSTSDERRLDQAFAEIIEDLSNQYLLAYPPTNPVRDGAWHRIRVEVGRVGSKVRARQGYRATQR